MEVNNRIDTAHVMKELCKVFSKNYAQFGNVWVDKFRWQKALWNESDKLGWRNRVCSDVTNMILSSPPRVFVPAPYTNRLIETEIFGRLNFDSILSKNFKNCMGIGDMVMTVYFDPIDNAPAINYVSGQNVIPLTFNNHAISELAWLTTSKIEDKTYIIVTVERLTEREVMLFEYSSMSLIMINYGSPLWTRILGDLKPVYQYNEDTPVKKFAWVSTGINNTRWLDTPFHNSFIWPEKHLRALDEDWELLQEEYKNSKKRIFVAPEIVKRTYDVTDANGTPIPIKKFNTNDTLFECVDLTEDQIKEWNPQVRFNEFIQKIKFDLELWGQAVGLGGEMYNLDRQGNIDMTATQVILSHREAFNTINNIKKNLSNAIQTIVFAMIKYWEENGMIPPEEVGLIQNPGQVSIHFDDGVFINRSAKVQEGLSLYDRVCPDGSHMISKFDLLTKYCGYSEDEAAAMKNSSEEELLQGLQLQMAMMASQPEQEGSEENKDESKKREVKDNGRYND